jgi:hypothetical protein
LDAGEGAAASGLDRVGGSVHPKGRKKQDQQTQEQLFISHGL